MIKTSIIVPVYNTAAYLRDCFDSIFNQTQKDIEVIAINDGSTDNSLEVLEEIKREHPDMIIISQQNKKQGAARNRGIGIASGEYIYFMDSDDCLADMALEICYQCAKEYSLDVVMFDACAFGNIEYDTGFYDRTSIIKERNSVFSGVEFANKYLQERFVPSPGLLYSSARFIREYELRFLTGIYYEDNEFYCRVLSSARRVMYIPEFLLRRRYRENSTTTSLFDIEHANDFLKMIKAVDQANYKSDMETVMDKIKLDFVAGLSDRCRESELFVYSDFANDFFETALKICGEQIQEIVLFQNIQTLYQICGDFPETMVSCEIKQQIIDRKKEILKELFKEIPMGNKDACIGIYGTGENTGRFLEEYQKNVDCITAKIIFIDSNAISGQKKYRSWDIYNVNDIGKMPFACIVVASSKYEQEMCRIISEKYGSRFKVIRLKSDLRF